MLRTRTLSLAALTLTLTAGATLRAQDSIPARKPFVLGLTANAMSIDPTTAGNQFVGKRSWGMQIDAGLLVKHHLYLGVDFGPQMLSDRASFTQTTTVGDLESSATLVYFSAIAGPRTSPFQLIPGMAPVVLGVYGGVSKTVTERSITNCVDCRSDTMDIPGGTFVQPIMLFGAGSARLRLSDRLFVGGTGIQSVMSVGIELGAR